MAKRFENPDFLEWTNGLLVDMTEFHDMLTGKYGTFDIAADKYDAEYDEWLWKKYERDTLFDNWDDVMKFVENVLTEEYVAGTPIYAFQKGDEENGYMYQVSLDYDNRLPGFEDVEL